MSVVQSLRIRRRILLVEPGYKNPYPPLGLMKISSWHKKRGDIVDFIKDGCFEGYLAIVYPN
uniref:Uncharacterized protein n=1 Tax=candidate division WOR-3 bacterium TaxID=2052148 RepID=A0A7C3UZU0_UNCW3